MRSSRDERGRSAGHGGLGIERLALMLTAACELRCGYCYVPKDARGPVGDGVIEAAARFFQQHARAGKARSLQVFGGEPRLALEQLTMALRRFRGIGGAAPLRVLVPTNLVESSPAFLALCAEPGVEVWASVDAVPRAPGGAGETGAERRLANGDDAARTIWVGLERLLAARPPIRVVVRMTITPGNVRSFSATVRALAGLGVERIVSVPALDAAWDDSAIAAYGEQHRRVALWLRGARLLGPRLPDVVSLAAVERRLQGAPKTSCGAGVTRCAVDLEGKLHACHRFLAEPKGGAHRLGDVTSGELDPAALRRFAALSPDALAPEDGECATCSAAGGCTHFCPADGMRATGRLDGVSRVACQLMREQVRAVESTRGAPVHPRASSAQRVAAAVLLGAAAAAACGGQLDRDRSTKPSAGGAASNDDTLPAHGGAEETLSQHAAAPPLVIADGGGDADADVDAGQAPPGDAAVVDAAPDADDWMQGCIG